MSRRACDLSAEGFFRIAVSSLGELVFLEVSFVEDAFLEMESFSASDYGSRKSKQTWLRQRRTDAGALLNQRDAVQ